MIKEVHVKISDRTKEILGKSTIVEKKLFLPFNLDRKEYADVNKIIEELGGKWKKGPKCHEFSENPAIKIKELLSGGALVDEKKTFNAFFTPPNLAARAVQIARVSGKHVLEPSAGVGNIAKEILAQGAKYLSCIEINKEYYDQLVKNVGKQHDLLLGDFLDFKQTDSVDVIVGNPPYSKNQWIKHLFHSWHMIKTGGKLVMILPNNRTNNKLVDWLDGKDYVFHDVEDKAFAESGTNISVMILEVNKL